MKKQRIYEIIDTNTSQDTFSRIYDIVMMTIIVTSTIPLAFKEQKQWMLCVDYVSVVIFIADYLLRWGTADIKYNSKIGYLKYPISPMAIIDLLSILPSITVVNSSFRLLKIFRLLRTFRIFRVFKLFRYSKSIDMIINVFKKQKDTLVIIGGIALGYVLISALVILNVEPDTFNNYFDAIYWATISLTTVGYGDIYPVTTIGKIITMVSSVLGIAIVALPAGVITAGMMEEIEESKK